MAEEVGEIREGVGSDGGIAVLGGLLDRFLLKDTPPEQLIAAIHSVCTGGAVISPSTTAQLIVFAQRHGAT